MIGLMGVGMKGCICCVGWWFTMGAYLEDYIGMWIGTLALNKEIEKDNGQQAKFVLEQVNRLQIIVVV